jgi:ABC-type phosphate/phosphonate transport system substrate-binding protein
VATPCYAAAGCAGADYCSLIVVRESDPAPALDALRGRIAANNSPESHSGWNVLRAMVAPLAEGGRFFGEVITTGSHARSLAAVTGGAADVAAIDAVNHALLARHRPQALAGTRVLQRSPRAPGLPYVAAAGTPPDTIERLRAGLFEALADPTLAACREALLIDGAVVLPLGAYDRILEMAAAGASLRDGAPAD